MHRNPTNLVQVPNRNAHFCENKKEEKGKKSKQKKAKKEEEKKKQSAPPPNPINSPTPYLYLYNNPARAHRDAVTNKQREKTKTRTRTKVGCVAAQQKRGGRPPLVDIPTNNYDTKSPLTENTGSDKNLPDTDPQSPLFMIPGQLQSTRTSRHREYINQLPRHSGYSSLLQIAKHDGT